MSRYLLYLFILLNSVNIFSQSRTVSEYIEGSQRVVEIYENGQLKEVETYYSEKLESRDIYFYDENGELKYLERYNSEGEKLYRDSYFRNSDGSLRRLIRSEDSGLYHHWFYSDNKISESWLIEGDMKTRSLYKDGRVKQRVVYSGDDVISNEQFYFSDNGLLLRTVMTSNGNETVKEYNSEGLLVRVSLLTDGILNKLSEYRYREEFLILETITGHGLRERIEYNRDDEGELTSTSHFINDSLKRRHIYLGQDGEHIEYYREDTLYQKEFYIDGERVQRDLYLNGELYRSEKFNE